MFPVNVPIIQHLEGIKMLKKEKEQTNQTEFQYVLIHENQPDVWKFGG